MDAPVALIALATLAALVLAGCSSMMPGKTLVSLRQLIRKPAMKPVR